VHFILCTFFSILWHPDVLNIFSFVYLSLGTFTHHSFHDFLTQNYMFWS
jgi:hypothetical protein